MKQLFFSSEHIYRANVDVAICRIGCNYTSHVALRLDVNVVGRRLNLV